MFVIIHHPYRNSRINKANLTKPIVIPS